MSENDLFSETSEEQEVQVDPEKNYLEELVGEDRKFKTPEDLARSKHEADLFIEQLKRETREMREELQKRLSLEEFADQFSRKTQQNQNADSSSNESETREDQITQEQRTPQDIEAFLEQKLTEREKSQKAQSNLNSVFEEMEKRYGSAANKAINERAKELGVNVQFLKGIAESSPKAFLDLFPQRQQSDDFSPPPSAVNRPASSGNGAKKFKDYEKMRKENPREYYTPRVQMEIFEQAKRQGESFYN